MEGDIRLAVDVIASYKNGFVIVDRLKEPNGLALPGGFLEVGETLEYAVQREFAEKINLKLTDLKLYRPYSEPYRDPRGHIVTQVFTGNAYGILIPGPKVKNAIVMSPDEINLSKDHFAFDHYNILSEYLQTKTEKISRQTSLVWEVHYMSEYYDDDPRMPGTVPIDERYYIIADTHEEALSKATKENPKLKKLGKKDQVVARPLPLENLIAARDASRDGRIGWISTTQLSSVQLSLKADRKDYTIGVCLIPVESKK
jgi:8-oxo-dGTP diphosphatase